MSNVNIDMSKRDPKETKKAIERVTADLAKKYKKEVITTGDMVNIARIPFGIASLDHMWRGGPVRGRFNMIYGGKSCGKTSLCYAYMASVQKQNGVVAYIDAEYTFDPAYAATFGVDVSAVIYTKPETFEEALTIIKDLSSAVDLIVVDSIIAIAPEAELERDMNQETMALSAKKLSQFFRIATGIVGKSKAVVLLINQTRTNLGAYIPMDSYPGGNALAHACSFVMHMRRGSPKEDPTETINDKEVIVGHRIYTKVEKTKISDNEGTKSYFDLMINTPHIDIYRDTLNMIEVSGILRRAGAWYYYKEHKFQGLIEVLNTMKTNTEMFKSMQDDLFNPKPIQFLSETSNEVKSDLSELVNNPVIVEIKEEEKKPSKKKKKE